MLQLLDRDTRDDMSANITSKIPISVQDEIVETAGCITASPAVAHEYLHTFLKRYLDPSSKVFHNLLRDMSASASITYQSFQGFNDPIVLNAQFDQYLQRMLAGCWVAIDSSKPRR